MGAQLSKLHVYPLSTLGLHHPNQAASPTVPETISSWEVWKGTASQEHQRFWQHLK